MATMPHPVISPNLFKDIEKSDSQWARGERLLTSFSSLRVSQQAGGGSNRFVSQIFQSSLIFRPTCPFIRLCWTGNWTVANQHRLWRKLRLLPLLLGKRMTKSKEQSTNPILNALSLPADKLLTWHLKGQKTTVGIAINLRNPSELTPDSQYINTTIRRYKSVLDCLSRTKRRTKKRVYRPNRQ